MISGERAEFYRSSPKVYVHYGADAPVWTEEHVLRRKADAETMLHIVIASRRGEVSLDDRSLGRAERWTRGRMQLPVSPGRHTVHLRRGGEVYSRDVQAYPGMTTIVRAGLR